MNKRVSLLALLASLLVACYGQPVLPSTPPSAEQIAELWVEPEPGRDLYWGVGGEALKPDPSVTYTIIETKHTGFSRGFTVTDPAGRKWSVKLPPEAPTEVVASRLLWGLGYHQPPIYYVGRWNAEGRPDNPQLPGRFRESKPKLHGLDAGPPWSYYRGPFVGTREQNGLLVLMAMLGNSDIKDAQNVVYKSIDHGHSWTRISPDLTRQTWEVPKNAGKYATTVKPGPMGSITALSASPV